MATSYYLIRIDFRVDRISRKFAQRRLNAQNFIPLLRAERACASAKIFQISRSQGARKFVRARTYTNKVLFLRLVLDLPGENLPARS